MVPSRQKLGKHFYGAPVQHLRDRAKIPPMRLPPWLAALLPIASLLVSCSHGRPKQPDLVGLSVPALELHTFDGQPVRLVEPGRPTLLVFLGTWCAPSRVEADRLVDLARRYQARGLRVVGVAVGETEGTEGVRRFAEQRDIPFPIVMGTPEARGAFGGTPVTPTAFVVGREGRIESQVVGMLEMSGLESAVSQLFAEAI
jgi:peroxiredoxin